MFLDRVVKPWKNWLGLGLWTRGGPQSNASVFRQDSLSDSGQQRSSLALASRVLRTTSMEKGALFWCKSGKSDNLWLCMWYSWVAQRSLVTGRTRFQCFFFSFWSRSCRHQKHIKSGTDVFIETKGQFMILWLVLMASWHQTSIGINNVPSPLLPFPPLAPGYGTIDKPRLIHGLLCQAGPLTLCCIQVFKAC